MNTTPYRTFSRLANWAIGLLVVLLSFNLFRIGRSSTHAHSSVASIAPYTVTLQETAITKGLPDLRGSRQTSALRSDGAIVQIRELLPSSSSRQISQRTILFPSGERVEMDDIRELKSTTSLGEGWAAASVREPSSKCLNSRLGLPWVDSQQLVQEEVSDGRALVKVRMNQTVVWLAKDLGCAIVKAETGRGDNAAYSRLDLVAIHAGEPHPELFQVPAQYREVRRSVLYGVQGTPKGAHLDRAYDTPKPMAEAK
jgi:hypothetical protein